MKFVQRAGVVGVAVLAVTASLSACGRASTSSSSDTGGGGSATGLKQVKTDFGVTDSTITLGELTDASGQFAAFAKPIVIGNQMYYDNVNKQGGICGRQVKLIVKDHGYDVNKAVPLYAEIKDQVLALQHVVGSPMNTKLLPNYLADTMTTFPVSWASSLLTNPYIVMVGPTYDVEMLNGIEWLQKNKGLKAGDTVGHIYQEGEYGANGYAGSKYAASKIGFNLIPVLIKPTDTDLTTQVTNLLSQGAKFILLTSGPKQSGSVVSVLAAKGADVTVVSNNPGYTTSLVEGNAPTAAAMVKYFNLVADAAPYTDTSAAVVKVRQQYETEHPDGIKAFSLNFGYGQAQLMGEALTRACNSGDMTRAGLHAAVGTIKSFDTGGLVSKLDYSTPGGIPSRETYIASASTADAGGLKTVQTLFVSDLAKGYTPAA
jgi:ABC-type branched-subunit amino acid transport system substrate-binding protein